MKKILIIGGGSIGERHLRCFLKTGRATVELCEISQEIRDRLESEYQIEATYTDLDEAIAAGPDAAVICVPAHLHIPFANKLLEKRIPQLIEKPLSTSIEDATDFTQAAESSGIPMAVAFTYRSHPALIAMQEAVSSGRFGRVLQVVTVAGQHFPFYRPAYREIYFAKRETGGGLIQDMFPHLLNAVEWFAGPLTSATADADNLVLHDVEVEDSLNVIGRHGEILASYSMNMHQAPFECTITVICEGGTARFEYQHCHWMSCNAPGENWEVEETFSLERDDLYINQAVTFLNQLESGSAPCCSLKDGLATLRSTLAVLHSADSKCKTVSIPENES